MPRGTNSSTRLDLPPRAVSDRVSLTLPLEAHETRVLAELDGPGCIRHIFLVAGQHPLRSSIRHASRKAVIRIFFDGAEVPHVEAPVGDFFGVMHGQDWYPVDTQYLSVKSWKGYNCYFPMPFATSARVELANGPERGPAYVQVDWHRYPGRALDQPMRFCARWRREMPTERYGQDYVMADADGPGELVGFVYGTRLLDETDRWSHGGAENIYLDGDGPVPAYLRGIGGEDTFGVAYGGALHPPESHLYAGMPYYVHDDVGDARPAQRVVGYRFFDPDPIHFERSLHMRFGCMANDICSTVYWYQSEPVRPFFELPDWDQLLPGAELPHGTQDLALPDSGTWWVCGPFGNENDHAMTTTLAPERNLDPERTYDGAHSADSPWLTEASREAGVDVARWTRRHAYHGFVDINHAFRPRRRGVAVTHPAVAVARTTLISPSAGAANLRVAWDDHLVLWVNDDRLDLGHHRAFRPRDVPVTLRAGKNTVVVKLSNTRGTNHGGWAFAFQAYGPAGETILPESTSGK